MARQQTVFMFSGQGSHYYHMGRELFEEDATFRCWMLDLDALMRERTGQSVLSTLYDPARNKTDSFERLLLTHPAIFMVELAMAHTLIARKIVPDYTLGTSLGTFAAAVVAGCFSAEDALTILLKQASEVEARCRSGGMIAVLADRSLLDEADFSQRCDLAADNFSTHFVLSAPEEHLGGIEARLKARGITHQRLAVRYPFHSRWFDDARDWLFAADRGIASQRSRIPLACCAHASFIERIPEGYFWTVARQPIWFARTIEHLESQGAYRYIDVGPAGSLATFLKYGLRRGSGSRAQAILSPFGGDLKNLALVAAAA
jgi:bacillaene synthase trans-acting acyltransferase